MLFPGLSDRVAEVRQRIDAARQRGGHGQEVRIVAVTKTHGPGAVAAVVAAGVTDIGENKVQEAIGKQDALRDAALARWHLIGHLQRNKVKFIERFSLFHALDSARLADAIDEFGRRRGVAVPVLIEVNVSGEASKGGYAPDDLTAEADRLAAMRGIRVDGVMTMAPEGADEQTLRRVFAGARAAREACRVAGHPAGELSMGMSGDFEVAVEEGATMVRLGTILFGERGHTP
jgi:hypothetical protein